MRSNVFLILAALSLPLSIVRGSPAGEAAGNTSGTVEVQGRITVTKSGGWLETGFAEWTALDGASGYAVYHKPSAAADSVYVKADTELVRGTRVDVPGLPANQYDLKIVPILSETEDPGKATVVRVKTQAHDRSGFAFDKRSPRGELGTSGGYHPDGSVNPESTILYITETTKETVQMSVTKGKKTTTETGIVAIQNALSKAKSSPPLIVRFIGTVTPPAGLESDKFKMMQLKDSGNVTYEGIGPDAQFSGWGLDFQRVTNVEVRNLAFKDQPEDQLSFQNKCINLWIHNNDHFPGMGLPGTDKDKAEGDGALDIKSGTTWVSVAYNHYHQTKKTSGVGFRNDTDALVMSFHHNFYDVCGSRMPRISCVSVHVYNNYYKDARVYCIAAAHQCSAFVQNNYFEHCERPIIIASQGHDLKDGRSTLSKNDGGAVKIEGNFMDEFTSDPSRFDPAVDASPGPAVKGGVEYNNFQANFGSDYPCALDTPEEAKANALKFAGRIE